MKNEKAVRHEIMNEIRRELKTQAGRGVCLNQLIADEMDPAKRDLYIQTLQKKENILGMESLYVKLAAVLRIKDGLSAQEVKFLKFVRKNKLH